MARLMRTEQCEIGYHAQCPYHFDMTFCDCHCHAGDGPQGGGYNEEVDEYDE